LVKIREDKKYAEAYSHQTYVTADGNPIVWLCRMSGQKVNLVPGSELIEPLICLAEKNAISIGLLGSTERSLERAQAKIQEAFPNAKIVLKIAPPMGFNPCGQYAAQYIDKLKSQNVGLCFLALGAPKQETFAYHAAKNLPQVCLVSIGAGLDFISGEQVRAPILIRRIGLEWLWRLSLNPRRLAYRYIKCFAILPRAIRLSYARR
jgi:exopolysaccharide biosynthesis WecB/TagA/CpsF family protein